MTSIKAFGFVGARAKALAEYASLSRAALRAFRNGQDTLAIARHYCVTEAQALRMLADARAQGRPENGCLAA